ncbi:hypothetical protein [Thermoleptolyngbya sp. C42_A2020_037]|nr:hypothetical protein [Thermoleptolyngbya sp. C42_A2020_037]
MQRLSILARSPVLVHKLTHGNHPQDIHWFKGHRKIKQAGSK